MLVTCNFSSQVLLLLLHNHYYFACELPHLTAQNYLAGLLVQISLLSIVMHCELTEQYFLQFWAFLMKRFCIAALSTPLSDNMDCITMGCTQITCTSLCIVLSPPLMVCSLFSVLKVLNQAFLFPSPLLAIINQSSYLKLHPFFSLPSIQYGNCLVQLRHQPSE